MPKWAAVALIVTLLGLFMVLVVMPALFMVVVAVTQIAVAVPADVNAFVYVGGWAVVIVAGVGLLVALAWAKGRIDRH